MKIPDPFLNSFEPYYLNFIQKISKNENLSRWINYSCNAPGKRLRPLITYLASHKHKNSFIVASAIELIHTYSLIHDDLPSMDNDDWRRGKLSLHKKFSEGAAILTGDALLTYAFEAIATHTDLSLHKKIAIITLLAKASGGQGLIEGQVLDLFCPPNDLKELYVLYTQKTSNLFIAALEAGCLIHTNDKDTLQAMRCLGLNFGIAFQLLDDIQDDSKNLKPFSHEQINSAYSQVQTHITQILKEINHACITKLCTYLLPNNLLRTLPC